MSFPMYNGVELVDFEVEALTKLEQVLGEPLPEVRRCDGGNFGFKPLNFTVDGLAVNYKDIKTLPSELRDLHTITNLYLNFNQLTDVTEFFDGLFVVKHIEMISNKLSSLPSNIKDMHELKRLEIDYNQITSLPSEIGKLAKLRYLDAGHNKLELLPTAMSELHCLESLLLSNNRFQSFPTQVLKLASLKNLDLAENNIQSIPEDIGGMQSLESLNLAGNMIEKLPRSMLSIPLQFLTISGNQISESDEVVMKFKKRGCKIGKGSNTQYVEKNEEKYQDLREERENFFRGLWE
ncbi:leucine-rich repeat domain-containing protein [Candidatus Thorarchaeota archaeon]|nr:MAG: leucine-rich repeat domain-containing protein [Candidatus Thorarchaeota archaeon]